MRFRRLRESRSLLVNRPVPLLCIFVVSAHFSCQGFELVWLCGRVVTFSDRELLIPSRRAFICVFFLRFSRPSGSAKVVAEAIVCHAFIFWRRSFIFQILCVVCRCTLPVGWSRRNTVSSICNVGALQSEVSTDSKTKLTVARSVCSLMSGA